MYALQVWVRVEGAIPGGMDAELSGSNVVESDGSKDGRDISGLAVKAVWGVCRFVSTLIALL